MKSQIVEDQDKEKPEEYKGDKDEIKVSSVEEQKADDTSSIIDKDRDQDMHEAKLNHVIDTN